MDKYCRSRFSLNNLLILLIISCLISLSYQNSNTKKKTNLQKEEKEQVTGPFPDSTIPTDLSDTIEEIFDDSNNTNRTNIFYPKKENKGLSAGAIVAIIVPSVVALGGVSALAFLYGKSPAPQTAGVPNFESSMSKFAPQNAVKEVEVIQPTAVVQQQPIYPIKKEMPSVIKVEPVESTNQAIPTHSILVSQNPLMNNDAVKTVTPTSQIIPENTISQVNP